MNTNIFDYATKELSQDSVIACILDRKDDIAKSFLSSMFSGNEHHVAGKLDFPKDFKIEKVLRQDGSIDVFVEISSQGNKYAVIIEDKTESELHDQQVIKYCSQKASSKKPSYAGIFFVYFKTGEIYFWEIDNLRDEVNAMFDKAGWKKQ